eukprot:SAG31_NODE_45888_length_257_cov_0.436709_1_plen_85_part_11
MLTGIHMDSVSRSHFRDNTFFPASIPPVLVGIADRLAAVLWDDNSTSTHEVPLSTIRDDTGNPCVSHDPASCTDDAQGFLRFLVG